MKKNNTAQLDNIDLDKDGNAKISSLMKDIFSYLSEQEVDITKKRFGIFERKHTLEEIGKSYGVTRERIRQIEGTIVKKIVSLNQRNEKLKELRDSIVSFVKEYGGIVEEYFLIDNFFKGLNENEKSFVEFLLSKVLIEDLVQEKTKDGSKVFYQLKGFASDSLDKIIKEVVNILDEVKEPLHIDDIFARLDVKKAMQNVDGKLLEMYNSSETDNNILFKKTVESYLNVSDAVKRNVFGMWGTKSWKTVSPKRMSDKIYLILNKEGRPLHFKEITKIINESGFDKKPARDVTVHNELIIDDRYVLVGRGIYALKSWGYKKGAVADIIEEIIRDNGSAMTKADILEEVSKQRIVKDSTIYLSLTNDKRFKKVATGKYDLAKR